MIIKPRIRGFICTTAHPTGCAAHVAEQIDLVRGRGPLQDGPKRVLVLGASGGYGLASRIVSAFGAGAATIGVSFEKGPTEKKTASAGWYNNKAFDEAADAAGLYTHTVDADAFADETKAQIVERIRADLGQIDLLVYSLASPVRQHPKTGELHRSSIKPLGGTHQVKTLHVERGEVSEIELEPADEEETANTVAVMGGEDWELWIDALADAGVLADGFRSVAFTYIGSELTWPIYWHGTLGKAKEDLDRAAGELREKLAAVNGDARVASLKAVVTQASSAIPVVPLYASLLFQVMKDRDLHETPIEHIDRLFRELLFSGADPAYDDAGRIRVDDIELSDEIQGEVKALWPQVTTENVLDLSDLEGFRLDFLRIFGFGIAGVDYDADVSPLG
ncbi:MAG: enoyl-ACP reductase FabV [Pseudomonadota bacterium]